MSRHDFEEKRCLIPTGKFYEWKKIGVKQKEKYEFFIPVATYQELFHHWKIFICILYEICLEEFSELCFCNITIEYLQGSV